MDKMKTLLSCLTLGAFLLAFSSVSAATVDGVVDDSTASSSSSWLIKVLMNNKNNAKIDNDVNSTANSGTNTFTSADDQSGTELKTGNASSATMVENSANNNAVGEEYASFDGGNNTIKNVKDSSSATTTSSDILDNNINNDNLVTVYNKIDAKADTGSNLVSSADSLDGTKASTGIAQALSGAINNFNFNLKSIRRTK